MKPVFLLIITAVITTALPCCAFFGASDDLWGPAWHVEPKEGRAFVCAGGTLLILDVKDAQRPKVAGEITLSSSLLGNVQVRGDLAYVAAAERGLARLSLFGVVKKLTD